MRKYLTICSALLCLESIAQPSISSITPGNGSIGSSVLITGKNFHPTPANNAVYFGTVAARVSSATSTSVTVTVPIAASYHPITITANGLTGSSDVPFVPLFSGNITNFFGSLLFVKQKPDSAVNNAAISDLYNYDLDGDGKPDFVATIYDNGSSSNPLPGSNPGAILVGINTSITGTPSFGSKQILSTGLHPSEVAFGDIDGDGKPDIVTANQGENTISVFRNTSTPGSLSFENKKNFAVGASYNTVVSGVKNSVAIGDFNNDGKPDIAASVGNANIFSVLTNTSTTGTISFSKQDVGTTNNTGPSAPTDLLTCDLNKDGKLDIVVMNYIVGNISIYKNLSAADSIAFAPRQDIPVTGYAISAADIDGDQKTDLLIGESLQSQLHILLNKSTLDTIGFASPITSNTLGPSANFIVENIDGDGKPDIVIGQTNGDSIQVLKNTSTAGSYSFTSRTYLGDNGSNSLTRITCADFDGDGLKDIAGSNLVSLTVFRNSITSSPFIKEFSPTSAGAGSTVTIKGIRFTGINLVRFGTDSAKAFTILSDTLLTATVGTGGSGTITLKNAYGSDSLAGFVFLNPQISLLDSSVNTLRFNTLKGVYSGVQNFTVMGKFLQSSVTITAPPYFQVSSNKDSGFSSVLSLSPVNNQLDSAKIYVRFKMDSIASINGPLSIGATNAITRTVTLTGSACDSTILFTPLINSITKDSTICFRDSLVLSSTSGSFATYKWSNGDSTQRTTLKASANITLQTASQAGCLSKISSILKAIKNSNPVPVLALTGSNTLISSTAPNYRWYFNNIPINNQITNTLTADKVGFYTVETSNDKICWDASNDFPIITVSSPLVNDTLQVKAYPNPATGGSFNVVATLQYPTNVIARVTVADVNGAILLQTNKFIFFGREIKIPVTLSVKGTVFVKVEINNDIKTQTVVLQ